MNKLIDLKKCVEIGYIKKTHGLNGEVMVVFHAGFETTLENVEYLFFEVDGLPVPFFIDEIYFRSDSTANILFELLESQEKAKQFVGCKLFTERENIIIEETDLNPKALIGVMVIDKKMGNIGSIVHIDDFGGNLVMTVNYLNHEVLIPLSDELVISFDPQSATLIMNCPEGIFDLED
jgi:16S rRNA processing protein RimM